MSTVATAKALDAAITALQAVIALANASKPVSDAIAARIAEGRGEWNQLERDMIDNELRSAKAYAAGEIAKQS
jgi:hypothetical protein